MSSITVSFYSTSELIHFFSMQENYINLLRSNSSGNPSVSSVITGLLRQKHPFCLNSWISSAPLLSSLCQTMPVTRIRDVRRVSSPSENWKVDASLYSWRAIDRVWVALCLLGLPPDFWKPIWVPLFISSYIHSEAATVPIFHLRVIRVWCFLISRNRTKVHAVTIFFFTSLVNRRDKWYKMRFVSR